MVPGLFLSSTSSDQTWGRKGTWIISTSGCVKGEDQRQEVVEHLLLLIRSCWIEAGRQHLGPVFGRFLKVVEFLAPLVFTDGLKHRFLKLLEKPH